MLSKADGRLGELRWDIRVHGLDNRQPSMWDYLVVIGNGMSKRRVIEVAVGIYKVDIIGPGSSLLFWTS